MSYNVPPPSNKPVWPIVLACLVLVIGIAVAAVFVGINFADDDEHTASGSGSVSVSSDRDDSDDASDEPATDESPPTTSKTAEKTPKDEQSGGKSAEPKDKEPKDEDDDGSDHADIPEEVDCGNAQTVLTTRTASFAASICRTESDTYVYRGKSDNVRGGIVLEATRDAAGDWVANNKGYEYLIDADTGELTITNRNTGEVLGNEPATSFHVN